MIAQFAVRLICGMSLTWLLMPRAAVTPGFFRIQTLVTLGLAVLAALMLGGHASLMEGETWLSRRVAVGLAVLIAVASYAASVIWMLGRRRPGDAGLYVIAACAAALLLGLTPAVRGWTTVFTALSEASAAWLLGAAMTAMLLGHWYLTATGMSLAPLVRLNQLLGAAALTRIVVAAIGLLTLPDLESGRVAPILIFLRWSAGCVAPILMVLLVWRILRYRNTQSATGVLFAAVILTIIGETTAALLARELNWPV